MDFFIRSNFFGMLLSRTPQKLPHGVSSIIAIIAALPAGSAQMQGPSFALWGGRSPLWLQTSASRMKWASSRLKYSPWLQKKIWNKN